MINVMKKYKKSEIISKILLSITLFVALLGLVMHICLSDNSISARLCQSAFAFVLFLVGILGGVVILVPQLRLASCSGQFLSQMCIGLEILPIFVVIIGVMGLIGDPSVLFMPLYPSAGLVLVASVVLSRVGRYKRE